MSSSRFGSDIGGLWAAPPICCCLPGMCWRPVMTQIDVSHYFAGRTNKFPNCWCHRAGRRSSYCFISRDDNHNFFCWISVYILYVFFFVLWADSLGMYRPHSEKGNTDSKFMISCIVTYYWYDKHMRTSRSDWLSWRVFHLFCWGRRKSTL